MGKRGKNKGGGQPAATVSEVVVPVVAKPVEIEKAVEEVKKVEEKKPVEIKKTEEPKVEAVPVPESTETAEGTLQKKKRNKKKKKTDDDNKVEVDEEPKIAPEKPVEPEKSNAEPMEKSETGTIKKKRNRRRKTNQTATETTTESAAVEKVEEESKEAVQEASESPAATDTIKKKRNRNKKKTTNVETPVVAAEKPVEPEVLPVATPIKPETTPASESNAELNKKRRRKRNNASKMSIVDELKIKQEAEEQKAREELKKEIKNREKLLEKIEMVLDARISDVSQAHSQQKLLGKISEDLSEIERTKEAVKASKASRAQEKAPKKDELVGKVQQVLDVTKKEIQNVQQQQAFVGLLEDELAKVKQNKEKYLKGDAGASTSGESTLPDTIVNMQKQITDINEIPKSKDALIREIENRDKLMQEIGKVLDVTKHEIKKVQKQKEIISNLETELQRVKEEEFNKKLEEMIKTEGDGKSIGDLPEGVDSSMFLENILANVENLKKQVKSTKPKPSLEKMDIDEAALEFIESMPPTTEPPKMTDEEKRAKMAELLGGLLRGPKVKSTKLEENAKIIEQEIAEKKAKEAKPSAPAKKEEKKETPAPAKVEVKTVTVETPPKVEEKVEAPKPIAETPKKLESPKKSPPAEKKSEQKSNKKDDVKKSPVKDHKQKDANKKDVKKEVAPVEAPKAPETPEVVAKPEPAVVAAPKIEEVKPAEPIAVPVEPKKVEEPPKVEAKVETPAPEKPKPSAPDSPSQSKNQKRDSKKGKGSPKQQQQQRSQKTSESKSEEKPVEKVAPVTPPSPAKPSLADIVKSQPVVEETKPPAEAPKAEPEIIKTEATFEVVAVPVAEAKVEEAPKVEEDAVKPSTETEQPATDPKNVERSDFASPANNQDGARSLKSDDGKKQSPASKAPKKAPQKNVPSTVNKTPQSPKPRPSSSTVQKGDIKKPAATKPTPAQAPAKETVVTEKKIEIPASEPTSAPSPMKNGTAKSPSPTKSTSPVKKPDVPPKPEFLKNGTSTKSPVSTPRKMSSENVTKQKSPSPRPSVTPAPSTQTKKPSVPPRPAHLKSSKPTGPTTAQRPKSNGTTAPKTNNTTTPKTTPSAKPPANKQTPTTFYCRPLLEQPLPNSEHEAFSEPTMDNKTLDPNPSIIPVMSSPEERQQQVKAILTKDDIKILFPSKSTDNSENLGPELKFLSKEVNVKNLEVTNKPTTKTPIDLRNPINVFSVINDDNDADDDCLAFKLTARPVFMTTVCQHCKFSISTYFTCKNCQMVSYCKDEHLKMDSVNHKDLCLAIQGIAKKRGGHILNMAGNLNGHEFKNLRIHTINLCEKLLNRQLKPFEREIFLYPRLCSVTSCREWRAELLSDCSNCRQVSHCTAHEIPEEHKMWCDSYALFQKLVTRQSCYGRIEPTMPHKVLKQQHQLTGSIHDLWKAIYKNTTAFKDDCLYSTMTQVATPSLTALYGYQKSSLSFKEQFTIHLVGAELQFEGSELDKWETFFLHLVPEISDLHIIFIGPELNVENLPVEIISRTRMCRLCRSDCRGVTFDFQCKKFYHDYCDSLNYSKPDLICFFNAGLYRINSFKGFDTWPKTIEAAFHHHKNIPVIVTSSAEYEAPLDLQRILSIVQNCDSINVIQEPTRNPYASIKPERNFVNEEIAPLIFKNQFYFVVQSN